MGFSTHFYIFCSFFPTIRNEPKIKIDFSGIDWVIVGGESGSKARPMNPEWVKNIKTLTEQQSVSFFFKQWGTWGSDGVKRNKKANGSLIDGMVFQEMPA